MSLIQSAKLDGHDPYRCLKDVLERLPTELANRIESLLPIDGRPHRSSRLRESPSCDSALFRTFL